MKLQSLLLVAVTATTTFAAQQPILGAFAIGVSNLTASTDFYMNQLGFVSTGQTFDVASYNEIVLKLPGASSGSALALMQFKDGRNVEKQAAKLMLFVEDVDVMLKKMEDNGLEILARPGVTLVNGKNTTMPTVMARDPDGYILEFNPLSTFNTSGTGF
ncbi:hypothetical protein K402DRAFT_425065 [Aulographum hederae CBS 113979]|uniref:VOC domain-containing protein n=1 Tax=Aulographum hederae CBS 113979 TaxID=1176131 RepID=A0A6G1GM45_9PEZI|nr:hypothetical protein K402DRAFT_425065 [Aulographum hederae CBS 113979]